jgi:hypothetical protein
VGSTIILSDPSPLVTFTMRNAEERSRSGISAVIRVAVPNTFVSYVVASSLRVLSAGMVRPTLSEKSWSIAIAALFCLAV